MKKRIQKNNRVKTIQVYPRIYRCWIIIKYFNYKWETHADTYMVLEQLARFLMPPSNKNRYNSSLLVLTRSLTLPIFFSFLCDPRCLELQTTTFLDHNMSTWQCMYNSKLSQSNDAISTFPHSHQRNKDNKESSIILLSVCKTWDPDRSFQ